MYITSRIILALAVLVFVVTDVEAKTREVVVGFPHWPPMKIVEGDKIGGIDEEILRRIEKVVDVRFVFKPLPWKRAQEKMRSGEVDLLTSMSISEERRGYAKFIEPAYWVSHVNFYVPINKDHIKSYDDLSGKKIGQIRGSLYFPRYDEDNNLVKINVEMENQLFQMLESNRLDVIIGFETTMDYLFIIQGYTHKFKKSELKIPSIESHFAFSKKSEHLDLVQPIGEALKEMVESGEIIEIRKNVLKGLLQQKRSNPQADG